MTGEAVDRYEMYDAASGTLDRAAFRRTLGRFATGVTVVTSRRGDEVHGVTANSFTSVSLDPPLVLVCIARGGRFEAVVRDSGRYCVNVLGGDHDRVSDRFAGRRAGTLDDFAEMIEFFTETGHPVVAGALAHLECTVTDAREAGDHVIFIGQVERCSRRTVESAPALLFYEGRYRWMTTWTRLRADDNIHYPEMNRGSL